MRSLIDEEAGSPVHAKLATQLFECLRKMEGEATPLADGSPTGLHGYKGFVDGCFKPTPGTPWENCWSDRICELLESSGLTVRRECPYADGDRQRCDLVIEQTESPAIWIEVKGCWRVRVGDDNLPGASNSAFVQHLYRAAHDVEKLLSIPPSRASLVGLLIVGFDTEGRPITDAHLKIVRDKMSDWRESHDTWTDPAYAGFRVRCWFWSGEPVALAKA